MTLEQALFDLLDTPPETIEELIGRMSPEIYERLKEAVSLGRFNEQERMGKEQLGQCSDSTELRHWYNQFMRFLKQHWSTLNEYQSVNWTNAERKRKTEEAVDEEQHREVA